MATAIAAGLQERAPAEVPGEGKGNIRVAFDGDVDTAPVLVYTSSRGPELVVVAILVTDYRIVIIPFDRRKPLVQVPLLALENVPELKQSDSKWAKDWGAGGLVWVCEIQHKLPFSWTLAFRSAQWREGQGLVDMIVSLRSSSTASLGSMFAFQSAKEYREAHGEDLEDGWGVYDVERELERQVGKQGVPEGPDHRGVGKNLRPWFRIAQLEPQGELGVSPTYPNRFVVPVEATDKLLQAIVQFRSRGRIPMVSYVHLRTGATIARASQPLTGLGGKRCDADEIMLESLLPSAYKPGGTAIPVSYMGKARDPGPAASEAAGRQSPPVLPGRPPPLAGRPPPLSAGRPPPLAGKSVAARAGSGGPSPGPGPETVRSESPQAEASKEQAKEKRKHIVIFDARSHKAARANAAGRGGGYEDISRNYKSGRIFFLDMGNVHAVLRSWEDIRKTVSNFNNNISAAHSKDLTPGGEGTNGRFMKHWESTGWVLHCQRLLWGASRIVTEMLSGNSVLVHCSDGWDRTSQLTSTAMLLIDPFYRTVRGFAVLVEKEWLAAGHKFAERCAHQVAGRMQGTTLSATGNDDDDEDPPSGIARHTRQGKAQEVSPIFVQWLDAVFQLLLQFPHSFEFTPALLEALADWTYSGRFGTFLCNFDKEREGEGLKARSVSVWTEVLRRVREEASWAESGPPRHARDRILNPLYHPMDDRVLRPSTSTKRLEVWDSLFLRHDIENSNSDKCPRETLVYSCARWKEEALKLRRMLRELGQGTRTLDLASSSEEEGEPEETAGPAQRWSPRPRSPPPQSVSQAVPKSVDPCAPPTAGPGPDPFAAASSSDDN
eukprot:Hpha_TRINITY_DN31130_c0_g1::TRINITY_DN31130_c0_g1_i1::g.33122::m.33122/K18082/MTMR3_4, ZFYVE10_11; myotubularin-related protein 3/4